MPTGTRIRANNVYGVISDNPLTAAATTFNSVSLPLLPVVASAHAVIVFDPKRVYGDPEIVVVTVHTAASTVATIIRGQYGTSPRAHPQGTAWAHVPIDEDWIEILTSITRPTDPYEGQFIFETDTNKLVGYGGVDWAPRDAGGQLGYAQITANSSTFTTIVDITGLSVNVTVGTGRRIKITWRGDILRSVADGTSIAYIYDGVTELTRAQGFARVAGESFNTTTAIILTPVAGAHTYNIKGQTASGTGNSQIVGSATNPAFILVEDIGAA